MRRRPRLPCILLNAASVVSLVLCLALAAVWARSFVAAVWYEWFGDSGYGLSMMVHEGAVDLCNHRDFARPLSIRPDAFWDLFNYDARFGTRWSSGTIENSPFGPSTGTMPLATYWVLRVPIWPACVLAALLPLARLGRGLVRRRRPFPGLCPACGYDLRATPGRCPECGAVPPPPTPLPPPVA